MSSAAATARFPYPIEDPETVSEQHRTLSNLGQLLLDSHADVNDDILQARDSWRSGTATTALRDTRRLATLMRRDSDTVGGVLPAVTTYIGKIEDARSAIDGIRDRYDQAVDDRIAANHDLPDWADIPNLRREYRDGVQATYQTTIGQLDTEFAGVTADLAEDSRPAVTALRGAIEVLAPNASTSMGLGQVAYEDASADFGLTGDSEYEYALRAAGVLQGPSPDGYYADWLENAEANGVEIGTIVQIARDHGITPADFAVLDDLEEVTDSDGKSFFLLPDGISGEDARRAVVMTYILNAGTGYADNADTDFAGEPYDSIEVQRILDRQERNDWTYDDDVAFVNGNGGRLATTPNGMMMGLGGNWLQDRYSVNGGTTWGDIFMLNIDDTDDPQEILRKAIKSGQAIYQLDDGSIRESSRGLDLDRLLHHEERHSQQWAALGHLGFITAYLAEAGIEWLPFTGANYYEKQAGLSDGGYG